MGGCCGARRWEAARSWLCLAGVFGINVLAVLPQSGYAILFDHLMDKFQTTRANIGLTYFLFTSATIFIIPVRPLVSKYGVKRISIVNAVVATIGYTTCAFAPNIWLFNILFSFTAGIGRACLFTLGSIEVQRLFHYNRGLATCIACLGYNVSDFIAPLLFAELLKRYGLFGTLLIHGGIHANGIVFTMLYPPMSSDAKQDAKTTCTENPIIKLNGRHCQPEMAEHDLYFAGSCSSIPCVLPAVRTTTESNGSPNIKHNVTNGRSWLSGREVLLVGSCSSIPRSEPVVKPTMGSMPNVSQNNFTKQNGTNCRSRISENELFIVGSCSSMPNTGEVIQKENAGKSQTPENCTSNDKTSNCGWFHKLCDIAILTDPKYYVCLLIRISWLSSKFIMVVHLASACLLHGLTTRQAATIISCFGIASVIANIYSSLVLNSRGVRPDLYLTAGLGLLVVAGTTAVVGIFNNPLYWFATMSIWGASECMSYPAFLLVLVNLVEVEEFHNFYMMVEGFTPVVAFCIAAPLCGWLADVRGDYQEAFILALVLTVVCFCASLLPVAYFHKRKSKQQVLDDVNVEDDIPSDDIVYDKA